MTSEANILYAVYLPRHISSIDYRAYADENERVQVLPLLLRRLASRIGTDSLLVVCHDERDNYLAAQCAAGTNVFVFRTPMASKLQALADVAIGFDADHLVSLRPEAVFCPSDLLSRLSAFHLSQQNHYTGTQGVPSRVAPEIYSRHLLLALAGGDYAGDSPDPGTAAMELARLRPETVRTSMFNVGDHYSAPPQFDKALGLTTAIDARRAADCLAGLAEDYEFEALTRWTSTAVEAPIPSFTGRNSSPLPQKLLYVSAASAYSGAEECLRGLAEGMREQPFQQFALVGVEGLLSKRLREAGCQVACANWNFHEANADTERLAVSILDAAKPSVVHCNSNPGVTLLRAVRSREIPVVTHVRVANFNVLGPAMEADGFLCVSHFICDRLIAAGKPPDSIRVVYDGVDPERYRPDVFDRDRMRSEFGLPAHAFLILMVARFEATKRHDVMLAALAEALQSIADLHLVLVGSFGMQDVQQTVQRCVRDLNLSEHVTVLPFQDDIRKIECAADVVVLPSDHEPLGTCVLEGMSLAKPVVVSNNGGTRELIEHGTSGLEFEGGRASALAECLVSLARNAAFAGRLGAAGRRRVLQRYSSHEHASQVSDFLTRVILTNSRGTTRSTAP